MATNVDVVPLAAQMTAIKREQVPYDEAIRRIKASRGKTLFLKAAHYAQHKMQTDTNPGVVASTQIMANVKVTKRHMVEYLEDAYHVHIRDRVLVKISEAETCLFIGGAI